MPNNLTVQPTSSTRINQSGTLHPLTAADVPMTANKSRNGSTLLWGSLLGLATLAGGGIYAHKHKLENTDYRYSMLQNRDPEKVLEERYQALNESSARLRNLIIQDYRAKNDFVRKNVNAFNEFDISIPFTTGKELQQKVNKIETEIPPQIQEQNEIITSNRQLIRTKLTALFNDEDWQKLRTARKQLQQDLKAATNANEEKIVLKKIGLVNDFLFNKVYPDKLASYEKTTGLTLPKVFEIINKDYKTPGEYRDFYNTVATPLDPFTLVESTIPDRGKLTLKKVFPVETDAISTAQEKLKSDTNTLKTARAILKKYREELKNSAFEYRKTQAIIDIKNQFKEMREIKSKIKIIV